MRGEMQVQLFNFFYLTLVRSVVLHLQSLWIIRFISGVSLLSDGTIVIILHIPPKFSQNFESVRGTRFTSSRLSFFTVDKLNQLGNTSYENVLYSQ
jgi:hypothetical protein